MARYVVVEFEDNQDAQDFVDSVQEHGGVFMNVPSENIEGAYHTVRPSHNYSVVGLYMRPTQHCTCDLTKKKEGFTQGLKYGIWVHPGCGKVARVALDAWGHAPGFGRNLLVDKDPQGRSVHGLLRIDGSLPEMARRDVTNAPGRR